ncbi:MutT/nudix family protein [Burkholderia cenocepacia]|uniref:NUDIX hydrolase n=1 Tax=Burkholderia cenocepacia TaxID=95486 RepID=UPI00158EBB69|nr:NUDIX hydrolase [Burkholderia cenocepacia]MCA7921741.1 NUDIX domain-containing protein [Burkholderia cenocepacia]MCW3656619.1 NUDIX domain-containing protein [Burkholderia cenocepacia]MDS0806434.1 NUDIX domain-containing protein [Burkholderia cenocepacia]CAD9222946.1 MutT/nudix family protein [Burkholderia cenocepacia]HEB3533767.1 NUDIX domain-containing protein [Burkholderia cenocepacia]
MPLILTPDHAPETSAVPIKERATVVCYRDERVLLVTRAASRWALPGGTIKRGETPLEAAHRELCEETGMTGQDLVYSMQFTGLAKIHHVFFAEVGPDQTPQANNEIAKCKWFPIDGVDRLRASIPTKRIVELVYDHEIRKT